MSDIDDMIKHLQGYQQADMDGVRVLASRQAIEKAARVLREQQAEIERLKAGYAECIKDMADWAAYADAYYWKKHSLAGDIKRHKENLK